MATVYEIELDEAADAALYDLSPRRSPSGRRTGCCAGHRKAPITGIGFDRAPGASGSSSPWSIAVCDGSHAQRRSGPMTKRIAVALIAVVAGASLFASPGRASCITTTAGEQRARADVIFDGVALEGPTATGVQRFRVMRYRKGRGPAIVRVNTGTIRRADGSGSTSSVSLVVKRGERWRIFARGPVRKILQTNLCDGSRRR